MKKRLAKEMTKRMECRDGDKFCTPANVQERSADNTTEAESVPLSQIDALKYFTAMT
tara:strand:- start:351 stop:521 length:171 start_codon:yes stop_codon:yes gene_type:complete